MILSSEDERQDAEDPSVSLGITTGTFYNFFGDKFGVLQEHYRRLTATRSGFLEFTEEKLSNPYQAICDYFWSMALVFNRMGKEFCKEFSFRSPEMMAGVSDPTVGNGIQHMALFLHKGQDFGSIRADLNPWSTAEYLVAGYIGIIQYWQSFSAGESLEEIARRMLPMVFAAVTDQDLKTE